MRILYVGNLNKGYRGLESLLTLQQNGLVEIVGVIAKPGDDVSHWYGSVSQLAQKNGLKVFMPENLYAQSFLNEFRKLNADWGLSNGSGMRLYKEPFFSLPKNGFLNIHFSPSPRYRGVYPIPCAIINDEVTHGFTFHKIDAGMDTGEVIYQEMFPILESDTGYMAYHRCEDLVTNFIRYKMISILSKPITSFKQDASKAITYYLKDMQEKRANLKDGMRKCYNFVRAFDFPPHDPSFIYINGEKYYLSTIPIEYGMKHGQCAYWPYNQYKIYIMPEALYDSARKS